MVWSWCRAASPRLSFAATIALFLIAVIALGGLFHDSDIYHRTVYTAPEFTPIQTSQYLETKVETVIKSNEFHEFNPQDTNSIRFASRNVLSKNIKTKYNYAEYESTDSSITMGALQYENQCDVKYLNAHFSMASDLRYISGCERIIYNRVPKCGSRTVVTTLKMLGKQNKFELIARDKPTSKTNFFTADSQKVNIISPFLKGVPDTYRSTTVNSNFLPMTYSA